MVWTDSDPIWLRAWYPNDVRGMTGARPRASGTGALRRLAAVVGVVLLLAGGAGIAAHYSLFVSTGWTLIASFTPLFLPVAAAALVLLVSSRRRYLAAVAVAVLAVGVWTQVPLYRAASAVPPAEEGIHVRVLQANIYLGQADTAALVHTVRDRDIDLLTVSELTDSAAAGLAAAGLSGELPYSFLRPTGGGGGTGIYSRYPLRGEALPGFVLHNLRATVDIPGAGPTAVYALHPLPPYPEPAYRWMAELGKLRGILGTERLPLIVGADFNSTYDHREYRRILDGAGSPIRDAAEYVGTGIVATYPADRWYPAVLAIDRILTRGGTPISFSRTDIPGSDHHGVIGEIRLDEAGRH
ncbi:MAG: endonuclease/exonuclease/phosphatase family protein [Mycobacterium sp.]